MIERPKRAVTRFFIPLIDVLILLFCIFLLMPFMEKPESAESAEKSADKNKTVEELRKDNLMLRMELDTAKRDVKKLQDDRRNPAEKLNIMVFEIDPKDGKLFYYKNGTAVAVPDQRAVQDVIDTHKLLSVDRDPFFLIRRPRDRKTGFPSGPQVEQYKNWFREVSHQLDSPFETSSSVEKR